MSGTSCSGPLRTNRTKKSIPRPLARTKGRVRSSSTGSYLLSRPCWPRCSSTDMLCAAAWACRLSRCRLPPRLLSHCNSYIRLECFSPCEHSVVVYVRGDCRCCSLRNVHMQVRRRRRSLLSYPVIVCLSMKSPTAVQLHLDPECTPRRPPAFQLTGTVGSAPELYLPIPPASLPFAQYREEPERVQRSEYFHRDMEHLRIAKLACPRMKMNSRYGQWHATLVSHRLQTKPGGRTLYTSRT